MENEKNKTIVLKAVGDIALFRSIQKEIINKGDDYIFKNIKNTMNEADLIFGNFEFSCTNAYQPKLFDSRHDFIVETSVLAALSSIKFTVLNIANNHIMDWGREGLITTKKGLEELGINCLGAGENLNEARRPVVIKKNGIKIGFLAYTKNGNSTPNRAGAPLIYFPYIYDDITRLKKDVDHIIVSLHWGVELSDYPHPRDIELGHKIIDAGAKVILGHHPHIVQGIEEYNNGLIYYSLGSFIFDPVEVYDPYGHKKIEKYSDKALESIIADIHLTKDEVLFYRVIPTKVTEKKQVILLGKEERNNSINRIKMKTCLLNDENMFYKQDALRTVLKVQWIAIQNLIKRNPIKAICQIISKLKMSHIEIILKYIFAKMFGRRGKRYIWSNQNGQK